MGSKHCPQSYTFMDGHLNEAETEKSIIAAMNNQKY